MYSNNILNFQDFTTISNACTKKLWKLIECTTYAKHDLILNNNGFYTLKASQTKPKEIEKLDKFLHLD